jgi:transketolase
MGHSIPIEGLRRKNPLEEIKVSNQVEGFTFSTYDVQSMTPAEIYGQVLSDLMGDHPEIIVLTADLAKSTKVGIAGKNHPDRLFNVGVAEENLVGIGAGMARAGLVPFISTFAVFLSMRAVEFVQTDICYQNLNCKLIGSHAGTSFAAAGPTHHSIEDIAIMRSLPNMTVIVPADGYEAANAVKASLKTNGPVYIRINRGGNPVAIYESEDYGFEVGKAIELHPGTDATIIVCGSTVIPAIKAAEILEREDGVKARVLNMHTIKPIDREAILAALNDTHCILTVEDHSIIGGLGSTVADVIAESGKGCIFQKVGIPDEFAIIGDIEEIPRHYKMDTDGIIENVRKIMGLKSKEG